VLRFQSCGSRLVRFKPEPLPHLHMGLGSALFGIGVFGIESDGYFLNTRTGQ